MTACQLGPHQGAREVELEWQGTRKTLDLCPPCEERAREDLARAESRINPFEEAPKLNFDLRLITASRASFAQGPLRRVKKIRMRRNGVTHADLVLVCGHVVARKLHKRWTKPKATRCEHCVAEAQAAE